jgi:predicted deacetylase
MQKIRFLIRLDDACPYMDRAKWQRMEVILDKHGVKPLVGVIPANADPKTMIDPEDYLFWDKVHNWGKKGWSIALHGYDHVCTSEGGMKGLNPFWRRSEFAGSPLDKQREKIKKGYSILKEHGFDPQYFFAPSHTFDLNTLEALRVETDIRIVSDTIGRYPYTFNDFVFIPQISGHCSKMPLSGIYTFCFHPNTMKDKEFVALENFLVLYKNSFISFNEIDLSKYGKKKMVDRLLSWGFFTYRKIRGLK